MKKRTNLTFREKWEISMFCTMLIIASTADSENTFLWFCLSIILIIGVMFFVPLLHVFRQEAKVSRKMRKVYRISKKQTQKERNLYTAV